MNKQRIKAWALYFTVAALAPLFAIAQAPKVSMSDFFGVNMFGGVDDPADIRKTGNWVRDYSQWNWLEPEKDSFLFTRARNKVNYDAYYKRLDSLGIHSLFVVQQTPPWISAGKNTAHPENFAPSGTANGLHATDYREAARFYYQLAARYGSRKLGAAHLRTADKRSGLALMDAIEVYNEPDGTWGNQMTAAQYAALLNAVYDGDRGRLSGDYGIKAADPHLRVSIGGMAYNLPSLKKVVAAAGRAPFDVINVHFYTFRYARENFRVAVPPEWSSLRADMSDIVQWGRKAAPGRPVWLTEIGFDTKPYSSEYVSEQDAANYLIRSYLLALGSGVEKCFWFIFKDLDNIPKPIVFSSSGLFANDSTPYQGDTRLKPKLTYWYNGTFRQLTEGLIFDPALQVPTGDSTIYRFDFTDSSGVRKLSVLWYCPGYAYDWKPLATAPASKRFSYSLTRGQKIYRMVRPCAGSFGGEEEPVPSGHEAVSLELNGRPLFVGLSGSGE